MAKKSDLLVLQEMANADLDIRCSPTLVEAKKVKQGGHLTFGIDADSLQKIIGASLGGEPYVCVCYIANQKQFFELKNKELELSPVESA